MPTQEPVAIIGYAYRAPGIGRKGLWDLLEDGKSGWSKVPPERFDQDAYYSPEKDKAGCFAVAGAHFLPDDIYAFDAAFFNIRQDEARAMDPQHRLILETAFEAAEHAGLTIGELAGTDVGVFAANESSEYYAQSLDDLPTTSKYTATATAACMFANRLSYFLDLKGPSVSIDAACASSASALHMACQSVRAGECSAAFVGAASLILNPMMLCAFDTMGALSPEGRCFSYDARASGFGRGEGAAALLIKSLRDAISHGDPIHAIIGNTACSHGGKTDGITVPSRSAQERLLLRVHRDVGWDPNETAVVEGHGTGTKVGDPIEACAIANVLASRRLSNDPVYLGSVKSNLGHTESTSGILGVIKSILMLQRGIVLPTAGFESLNPAIDAGDNLRVPFSTSMVLKQPSKWPPRSKKRICVSNFGFGGSNAAILLEQYVPTSDHLSSDSKDEARKLYTFSAKSESSLRASLQAFRKYLQAKQNSNELAQNLSYTLGQRRTHFPYRSAISAGSVQDLEIKVATGLSPENMNKTKPLNVLFVFTGQGAQWARMARGLHRYDAYTSSMDKAERCLKEFGAQWSLQAELDRAENETRINEAVVSQPACTAVQLALIELLRAWGVMPHAVIGHSSGEIAAAYAAGLISFEAAMAVAYFRGQAAAELAQNQTVRGAMLALGTNADCAFELISHAGSGYATVAAINSPNSVTVSGDAAVIEFVQEVAQAQGIFARRLKVDVAYHSRHLDKVAASYLADITPYCSTCIGTSTTAAPKAAFVSSVTGQALNDVGPSYWIKNLLQPVRLSDAMRNVFSDVKGMPSVIVEVGPHAALKGPNKQTLDSLLSGTERPHPPYIATLARGLPAEESLLDAAARLYTLGADLHFASINLTNQANSRVLTDLPPYEWNKSERYIHESRIAQRKQHPDAPYHPFLGWKSPYNEGNVHCFRQVFTLDEMPWLRDHNIAGEVIFPMTGYIALGIEAVRAVSRTQLPTIVVKELHAKRSLTIEEDLRVDIFTKLQPLTTGAASVSDTIWSFEVLSCEDAKGWTTHCCGQLDISAPEADLRSPAVDSARNHVSKLGGLASLNASQEYAAFAEAGLRYGPAFKNMVSISSGPDVAIHQVQLRRSDLASDAATLDSLFHALGVVQAMGARRSTFVPHYFRQFRIRSNLSLLEASPVTVVTQPLTVDPKLGSFCVNIVVWAQVQENWMPVCEFEQLTSRSIADPARQNEPSNQPESYDWTLEPHLDLADSAQVREVLGTEPIKPYELERRRQLNEVAVYFMRKALNEISEGKNARMPLHLRRFRSWAERVVIKHGRSSENVGSLIKALRQSDAQGEMLCAVGEQLTLILKGSIQPLEIMLKDGLLSRNYVEDVAGTRCNATVADYLHHLTRIRPHLRILEIGGGTASATYGILKQMSRTEDRSALSSFSYTFTDISSGFFSSAQEKLAQWSDRIEYQKLDISKDPLAQGFTAQSFDIVIAGNVLHATPDIAATIDNARSLLCDGGKLVLLECMNHPPLNLPFALLPGWWDTQDQYRTEDGPMLSPSAWHFLLSERGFSGTDIVLEDFPGTDQEFMSVIASTKISRTGRPVNKLVIVCEDPDSATESHLAGQLQAELGRTTDSVLIKSLTAAVPDGSSCIFLDSADQSILASMSKKSFEALQRLLTQSAGVLWVVPQGSAPESRTIKGLLRTLRLEYSEKHFLLLEDVPNAPMGVVAIAKVAKRLQESSPAHLAEQEFIWSNGLVHVPRLRPKSSAEQLSSIDSSALNMVTQTLCSGIDDALEMTVDAAGSLDSIYFRRSNLVEEPLGADEIIVQVQAAGVNFRDLLLVLGSMPWHAPGLEGAGMVTHVGSNVKSLRPGDRVFYASMQAGFSTYVRIPALCAYKLPGGLDAADAATMPIAYSTALWCLLRVAQLRPGESLLVHAASGAVGQALITVAKNLGAVIFATAGTPEKRKFLHDTFSIPMDHIFSSRTSDFHDELLCATNGTGVDVVVNSLSGHLLERTFDVMADFGRFVELGKKDFLQNNYLAMRPFDRNVTFSGVDLRQVFLKRPEAVEESLSEIAALYETGIISPIRPTAKIPISDIESALRKLQTGQNIGKIVLTLGTNDTVLAEPPRILGKHDGKLLRCDGTYLVTGGTGGIGRSLAPWLFKNGAKAVVLLGRSGDANPEVAKLLQEYQGTDKHLRVLACDVGSRSHMANIVDLIKDLPPVRGVIHGALYLRDSLFENANFEDWDQITAPKIKAAWHLHELFPDLDFFVSLASVTGVTGHAGQSIYAGTTSFLDAFTTYRRKQGLPASSIILPVIEDAGYVKDRNLSDPLKKTLGVWLNTEQLFMIIKDAILDSDSGLCADGRAMTFIRGASSSLPWERFNMLAALRQTAANEGPSKTGSPSDSMTGQAPSFLESLMNRVCTLTMMEKDEVTPERSLNDYGLDSLVSVELRNWIKRESGVEVALNQILSTPNLKILAENISAQQEGK